MIILWCFLLFTTITHASTLQVDGIYSIGLINAPQDIDAGMWDTTNDIVVTTGYCAVATKNGSERRIFHNVVGDNPYNGNFFQLQSADGDLLRFRLAAYRPSRSAYLNANPEANRRIDNGLLDCTGQGQSPNSLRVTITAADMAIVPPGTYTETLTIRSRTRSNQASNEVFDTITVTVFIPYSIQVHQLDDLDFGVYAGSGDLTLTEEFCVFVTQGGTYNIMVSDDSAGNGWALTHNTAPASTIAYDLQVTMTQFLPTFFSLLENTLYSGPLGSDDPNCITGEKAYLKININEADIVNKTGGIYTSLVTIFVSAP
jgi:spore coat protein U-like protein